MAMRTEYCGLVTEALLGQTVTLSGWVNRRRDHGGVLFIDLRDREGYVQIVCDPDRAEMFKIAEDVRNEFCVQVKGLVRARPEGTTNDNMASGKIEVLCHELNVLNASVTPPFQIDEDNLSETTRLTHRVLDLRRPYMQNNLKLRYKVAMEVRKFLDTQGFIDIETPMLTKSTPEGARDFVVPSRLRPDEFYALPQSPQQLKRMLCKVSPDPVLNEYVNPQKLAPRFTLVRIASKIHVYDQRKCVAIISKRYKTTWLSEPTIQDIDIWKNAQLSLIERFSQYLIDKQWLSALTALREMRKTCSSKKQYQEHWTMLYHLAQAHGMHAMMGRINAICWR